MKQIVLIYGGLGLDRLERISQDSRSGIYISSGSYSDALCIQRGDYILFFETDVRRARLFEYTPELAYTDANNRYIEIPRDTGAFHLSIETFRNVFFIDIDRMRPWVRSPITSGRNLLLLSDIHILPGYMDIVWLRTIFAAPDHHLRIYTIARNDMITERTPRDVVLDYRDGVFGLEYSAFAPEGRSVPVTGLPIDTIVGRCRDSRSSLLEIYEMVQAHGRTTLADYVRYYDMTRGSRIIKEIRGENGNGSRKCETVMPCISDILPPPPVPWAPVGAVAQSSGGGDSLGESSISMSAPPVSAASPAPASTKVATLSSEEDIPEPVMFEVEMDMDMENDGIDGLSMDSMEVAERMIEKQSIEKERMAKEHREEILRTRESVQIEVEDLKRQIETLRQNYQLEYFLNKSAIDELGYDRPDYYEEIRGGALAPSHQRGWIGGRVKKLRFVLPALRISYLGQWKEIVSQDSKITASEKSIEMAKIIAKFDDILAEDQKREQKNTVFRWLMFFLFFETIAVFGLIWLHEMPIYPMTILVTATLMQITVIVYHIVKNLYPVDTAQVERLPSLPSQV